MLAILWRRGINNDQRDFREGASIEHSHWLRVMVLGRSQTFCTLLFIGLTAVAQSQASVCSRAIAEQVYPPPITSGNIVIADAISTGNLIAPAAKKRGFDVVHLLSDDNMEPHLRDSIRLNDFSEDRQLVYRGDLEQTARELSAFKPVGVIIGGETGVLVGDMVSERLGLMTNGTTLSEARRNKYLMWETARAAGVEIAAQFVSRNINSALAKAPSLGFPVVLKPLDGAAGIGLHIEHDADGITHAFNEIRALVNPITNRPIVDVLFQEYLDGPEYVVDTMSSNGKTYVTAVSRYTKVPFNGQPQVYAAEDIISYQEAVELGLIQYAQRVVRALGIEHGPAHLEIKKTEKGCRLVEIGARLSGGGYAVLVEKATGLNVIDLLLDVHFDPAAFHRKTQNPFTSKPARIIYLMTEQQGKVISMPYMERIEKLDSWFRSKMNIEPRKAGHDILVPTTDFLNYPGQIELVHHDRSVIDRDSEAIRQWEKQPDFYVFEK